MTQFRLSTLPVVLMLALSASGAARAVSALPLVEAPAPPSFPSVFGAGEAAGSNFAAFRRWTAVLERIVHEAPAYDEACALRFANRCVVVEWRQLLAELRSKSRREQIDGVNAYFNRFPYVLDPSNWGIADYWSSPLQFLARSGDCEDYAIAKYVSLRQLGFQPSELRIVVLDDLNLRTAHAVLGVADGERLLILDNQIAQVMDSRRIVHYRPIYSINEDRWWLHRGR